VQVTYHNADGSAAPDPLPERPFSPSHQVGPGRRHSAPTGFVEEEEEELDDGRRDPRRSAGPLGAQENPALRGFTKTWLELGARRGSLGGSAVGGHKRWDLDHLRAVCVGRQTDTFRRSRRQPPPPPPPLPGGGGGVASSAASAASLSSFDPLPGSPTLCLSLIGGEGWGHRSLDLEFKSLTSRDNCLRFFRGEMRRIECRSGMGLLPPTVAAAAAARASAAAAVASEASAKRRRNSTLL
jgi:hypothetical protein